MSKLQLSQILGSSSSKYSHIAYSQDCLIYVSGSFIVFYNPVIDEQVRYIKHDSAQIHGICTSPCHKYLAISSTGQCNQKQKSLDTFNKKTHCTITIYELQQRESNTSQVFIKIKGHKYKVDHIMFSLDSKFLITICNKDGSMFIWNSRTGQRLTQNKNTKSIYCIKFYNQTLITVSRGSFKIWSVYSQQSKHEINRVKEEQHWILTGRSISLNKKFATKQFIDICIWKQFILLLSLDGLLCLINNQENQQKLIKCIDLMMTKSSSMDLLQNSVICGGDNSMIKIIDLQTLTLTGKFPKPPPLNKQNITKDIQQSSIIEYDQNQQFPNCVCIKVIGSDKNNRFIISLYDNLTIFIWKSEPQDIIAMRSIITHRARIKSIKILEQFKNDLIFFSTISEDNTLRIWHIYKRVIYNRQSIDIAQLIGVKRNAYCRNLSRIIYMQSQKQVTCISEFSKKSVACIAHRQFIMYSLQNFQVVFHELLQDIAVALQIKENLAYIGFEKGKVVIYQIIQTEDRLHKIRQLQFQTKIQNMKIISDQLKTNEKYLLVKTADTQQVIIFSLAKSKIVHVQKSVKCCTASGINILLCKTDCILIYNITKNKCSHFLSLKHQMNDQGQFPIKISCNLLWIAVLTSNNKLIVCNFSPAVICNQNFNQNINDIAIGTSGQIIIVGDYGNIMVYRIQNGLGYQVMEEEVKKWIQKNDMSWMDGSVWAQKRSSQNQLGLSVANSLRLRSSVNKQILKVELPNVQIKYKNNLNDNSVFNPSDILKQANQIYNKINNIQKKNTSNQQQKLKANIAQNNGTLTNKVVYIEDEDGLQQIKLNKQNLLNANQQFSRPPITKKRIFGSVSGKSKGGLSLIENQKIQQESGQSVFSQLKNNLVDSVVHIGQPKVEIDKSTNSHHKNETMKQSQLKQSRSSQNVNWQIMLNRLHEEVKSNNFVSKYEKQLIPIYQILNRNFTESSDVQNTKLINKENVKKYFARLSQNFVQFLQKTD